MKRSLPKPPAPPVRPIDPTALDQVTGGVMKTRHETAKNAIGNIR